MNSVLFFSGALVVLVAAVVVWMGMPKGPSLGAVAHLREPHILSMAPQRVLLVTARGDPGRMAKQAFGALMKAYFSLKGVPRGGPSFKPPRGRWPVEADLSPEEWVGLYAMPVPDSVTELPAAAARAGLPVELTTWEYGEVAQILHVGRYDRERPTVDTLRAFIEREGYRVTGLHEEEYIRGPGMLFAGNPDGYLTLIRYPVARVGRE